MNKHKDDREEDMLVKYLTDTNCMKFIKDYGESNERDLTKMMSNVETLV